MVATLGYRRNGQKFAEINTALFSGRVKFGSKRNGFHSAGLQALSDKEGFVLRRNRVAATYARHQRVSEKYYLAAGLSAGFYNFSIRANDVTGGVSSYVLDGALSVKLYGQRTEVGIGVSQANQPSLTPIGSEIVLERNLNVLARQHVELNSDFTLIPAGYARYSSNRDNIYTGLLLGFGTNLLMRQHIVAGANWQMRNGMYASVGVRNIEIGGSRLGGEVAYYLPNRNVFATNVQRFELFLTYHLEATNN